MTSPAIIGWHLSQKNARKCGIRRLWGQFSKMVQAKITKFYSSFRDNRKESLIRSLLDVRSATNGTEYLEVEWRGVLPDLINWWASCYYSKIGLSMYINSNRKLFETLYEILVLGKTPLSGTAGDYIGEDVRVTFGDS